MKKKIFLLLLAFSSLFFTSVLLLISFNYYLKFSGKAQEAYFTDWMVNIMNFDPEIIFWSKSWCTLQPNQCNYPEEKILPLPIVKYRSPVDDSDHNCQKILFIGDSFTVAPWTSEEHAYSSIFAHSYSQQFHTCVLSYRLATGGANNFQEFKAFSRVVDQIKPDLVIWQFYWNDIIGNPKYELYSFQNGELKEKSAWKNSSFLVGFLNQFIPFLKTSSLGKHLMYLGENKDLLHAWPIDFEKPEATEQTFAYNEQVIPALLKLMEKSSQTHQFQWYTTLAPLESQFIPNFTTDQDKNAMSHENFLRQLLQHHSHFISMENLSIPGNEQTQVLGVSQDVNSEKFFNNVQDRNAPGGRHLSPEGNRYFGGILFQNFPKH